MKKIEKVKLGNFLVGEFFPQKKLFLKKVKRSVHLFRKLDAWGIDNKIIEALDAKGCLTIRIWERELKTMFEISMKDWKEKAVYLQLGHNLQQFAELKYFRVGGSND